MSTLNATDLRLVLQAVACLNDGDSLRDFPTRAMAAVKMVVAADAAAYNELSLELRRNISAMDSADADREVAKRLDAFECFMHTHPVLQAHRVDPLRAPTSVSDLITLDDWRKRPIYEHFYKGFGFQRQIVLGLAGPEPVVGLALNRAKRDFSSRERARLAALAPHLRGAYWRAARDTYASRTRDAVQAAMAIDGYAWVVVDPLLRILDASATAWQVLHLEPTMPAATGAGLTLPRRLSAWAAACIRDFESKGTTPRSWDGSLPAESQRLAPSLQVGNAEVRLVRHEITGYFILLARETRQRLSRQRMAEAGLTSQECRVLESFAAGRKSAEVAALLGISPRTVDKHAERILSKLRASTRMEAVLTMLA